MALNPPLSFSATLVCENFIPPNVKNSEIQFSPPSFPKTEFVFGFISKDSNFPTTFNEDFQNDHFVYLIFHELAQDELSVEYRVSIVDSNGDKLFSKDYEWDYSASRKTGDHSAKFISRNELTNSDNKFIIENKLTLLCEIKVVKKKNLTNTKSHFPHNYICDDYESLLECGKFSDAALIIGQNELPVHKAILSVRSKVFASMFEHDCKEKLQNRVDITDLSVEVCKQMLSYIYTGKVPDLSEFAAELFVAADKYQLDHLKISCEQYLSASIGIESAANTLLLADMHSATVLKTKSMDYIIGQAKEVITTDGWKHLAKTRPDLAVQLFESMANKQ